MFAPWVSSLLFFYMIDPHCILAAVWLLNARLARKVSLQLSFFCLWSEACPGNLWFAQGCRGLPDMPGHATDSCASKAQGSGASAWWRNQSEWEASSWEQGRDEVGGEQLGGS